MIDEGELPSSTVERAASMRTLSPLSRGLRTPTRSPKLLPSGKEQERSTKVNEVKNLLPYSDALATEICERISAGELLTVICLDEHLPTVRRCNQWLRDHGEFAALYQSALSDRLSIFEEQIIQIPDEAARDFDEVKSKGNVRRVLDPGKLTAAKLRVEVRRLHLKAGKPDNIG